MTNLLKMAFRNVLKNWRHSLAAILTISAGFVTTVLFSGYMSTVALTFDDTYRNRAMSGDFIIENREMTSTDAKAEPFKYLLSEQDQTLVENFFKQNTQLLEVFVRFLQIQGMVTNGRTSTIFVANAFDPVEGASMRGPIWRWNSIYGVPLQETKTHAPVILGQTLGRTLGCVGRVKIKIFNSMDGYPAEERAFDCVVPQIQLSLLTEKGQLNALDFDVVGLQDAGYRDLDSRYLTTTLQSAQTLLNTKKISFYTLKLRDPEGDRAKFLANFTANVAAVAPHLRAIHWKEHPTGELYRKTMSILMIFKVFVITVILAISCLSILNTMIKIVKERTREIGTLRSFGFVRRQILFLFSAEAFFLSAIGVLLGAVMSVLSTVIINTFRIPYKAGMMSEPALFWIKFYPHHYLTSFLLLASLAVVAALLAARDPIHRAVAQNLSYA